MKWVNITAAADNYPTDGRGARTATAADSAFLGIWDNKACVLVGMIVNPGTAAGTITITAHDGSADPVSAVKAAANASSFWVDLHGIQTRGLKVVAAGAACTAVLFFDVGQSATY